MASLDALAAAASRDLNARIIRSQEPIHIRRWQATAPASDPCGDVAAPVQPTRLRVLLVDGHSGPMSDAAVSLQCFDSSVSLDLVPFYAYKEFAPSRRRRLSRAAWTNLSKLVSYCNTVKRPRYGNVRFGPCMRALYAGSFSKQRQPNEKPNYLGRELTAEIENAIDVVMCQFPGFQCALFDTVRVAIVLRFTHRYHHHISGTLPKSSTTLRQRWEYMLLNWHRFGRAAFFADNGYDKAYLWHYLRIPSISWPASGARLVLAPKGEERVEPKAKQEPVWCFCCEPEIEHSRTLELVRRLRQQADRNISFMRDMHVPKSRASSLAQTTRCTAFVLLPHSLHSYTSVEAYAAGFPMVVPSAELLSQWHADYGVITHRCSGLPADTCADRDTQPAFGSPLVAANTSGMASWLSLCDFLQWPHTQVLDNESALPEAMASTPTAPRLDQTRYMRTLAAEASPRVLSAISRAVRLARSYPFPRPRFVRAEDCGLCRHAVLMKAKREQRELARRGRYLEQARTV